MKLSRIARELALRPLTAGAGAEDPDVTAGYVSDLLSDVLASAPAGGILVTVLEHMNVVAVAMHADLAAVVFASNREPDKSVIERASQEGVALFISPEPAFELVGRLYQLGIRSQGSCP